jgi:cytochrome c-type biogenesis protein
MLLSYSAGLGLPFIFSALLIDQLKGAFNWVKSHYGIINKVCGVALIVVGAAMATGMLGRLLNLLS